MSIYLPELNPAAVLGHSLQFITLAGPPSQELTFTAVRTNSSPGKMCVQISAKDEAFFKPLEASPSFSSLKKQYYAQSGGRKLFVAYKLTYGQVMELMSTLRSLGLKFDSELANYQADVVRAGVSNPVWSAYEQFVADATKFLQQVQALNLGALSASKGVRAVESPFRAVALTKGSSALLVSPDPYDARYVQVTIRGKLTTADVLKIRELAYNHYEKLGIRVQLVG